MINQRAVTIDPGSLLSAFRPCAVACGLLLCVSGVGSSQPARGTHATTSPRPMYDVAQAL